jgi:hypothetical protein
MKAKMVPLVPVNTQSTGPAAPSYRSERLIAAQAAQAERLRKRKKVASEDQDPDQAAEYPEEKPAPNLKAARATVEKPSSGVKRPAGLPGARFDQQA